MSEKKDKPALWIERVGKGSYVARNASGAEVKIGHGEGEFTPGELFKLGLAGCKATSLDARFASVLGDDYRATVGVDADYDKDEDRFTSLAVEIVVDANELPEAEREQMVQRALKAIDRLCTIGHTLDHPVPNTLQIKTDF